MRRKNYDTSYICWKETAFDDSKGGQKTKNLDYFHGPKDKLKKLI